MKRVAIIADSHFCEYQRFEECVRIHDWIADDIRVRGVDLVLHSGDVYERKSSPRERQAVAAWVQHVTENAPLVIVRGNHDAIGDLPLLERLETEFSVRVVEGAEVVEAGGCVIGCLAWPSKSSVLALSGAESHAEGELVAGEALRNVLRGLGQEMAEAAMSPETEAGSFAQRPRILLAHAMVRGSVTSTGQPLVGCDLEVGIEDLALTSADLIALGHIHKGQSWGFAPSVVPAVYPGSPRRTTFGEVEKKGYVIATFEGSTCTEWQLIETPCAPMLLVEADYHDGQLWHELAERDVVGAEVRVRYSVDTDKRDAAREAAEQFKGVLLLAGAKHVKVEEEVRATGTARAPEVATAKTVGEKLAALWKARENEPPEERRERLLSKVCELEAKAS